MTTYADAQITADYIDGLSDAIALMTFIATDAAQVDAAVRALTDLAADPKRNPKRRELLRLLAMKLHDHRTRDADWKASIGATE
ncbi:hypothetical protein [Stenotrophomonas sp. TWI587]|uniref:hypothetical protein n=1 Tax=Stenotrophomonas sp. TWI587 TaxID=3136783 RepID=UPI003209142B